MTDVITQAHRARTQLAQALTVLQLDDVPAHVQEVAGIVAQAMSLLHRIETKGEQAPAATQALSFLRSALNQLQAPENAHPATETALEVVAGSLGLVHQLSQSFVPQVKAAPGSPPMLAPTPVAPPRHPPTPTPQPVTARAEQAPETPLAIAATQAVSRDHKAPAALDPAPKLNHRASSEEDPIPLSRVSSPPTLPSAPPAAPAERPSDNPGQRISNNPGALPPIAAQPGESFVEAALGAYSTTNFYKGLSGNDIIDAGGLFIATYTPPEMGEKVRVNVSLPGGFEFQARGVVTWVREMPKSGSLNPMSPPGYGVRFTEISKEARQLVYRYVRNREPLFYDDI